MKCDPHLSRERIIAESKCKGRLSEQKRDLQDFAIVLWLSSALREKLGYHI